MGSGCCTLLRTRLRLHVRANGARVSHDIERYRKMLGYVDACQASTRLKRHKKRTPVLPILPYDPS